MNIQDLIQSYRFFDIACGLLETNERMRSELFAIRQQQIESRQKTIIERSLLIFAALVTGVPILNEFIKDNITYKYVSIFLFVAVVFFYWIFSFLQFRVETKNAANIAEELKKSRARPPEESPTFLLMLASTYGTRLSLAREIFESTDCDASTRLTYSKIVEYWKSTIDSLKIDVNKMHEDGILNDTSQAMIIEWLDMTNKEKK